MPNTKQCSFCLSTNMHQTSHTLGKRIYLGLDLIFELYMSNKQKSVWRKCKGNDGKCYLFRRQLCFVSASISTIIHASYIESYTQKHEKPVLSFSLPFERFVSACHKRNVMTSICSTEEKKK